MARAAPSLSAIAIRKPFEEVALLWKSAAAVIWRGARLSGEFEVSIEPDGQWSVSDLWVETDNGKFGPEARGHLLNLDADADERLYLTILDALDVEYGFRIMEWVADEIDARGLRVAA